jgi:hypothetical protein
MKKNHPELSNDQMEKVNGGTSCRSTEDDRLVTSTNPPVCAVCYHYVQSVRSHFVCVNARCSEFGIPKTKEQVIFK